MDEPELALSTDKKLVLLKSWRLDKWRGGVEEFGAGESIRGRGF